MTSSDDFKRNDSDDSISGPDDASDAMPQLSAGDIPTERVQDGTGRTVDQMLVRKNIGPYKILHKIAEGGMGTVYMANQQRPIRRRVALKVIQAGRDSEQIIARFEAERQALALMDHPHIARIFDAGTFDDGSPYFVMELVKGIPITEYCDRNKLSIEERLRLFVPICQAVQHAHQKGIIHRDLKPSNVLVAIKDGQPTPKVIDFGLAKATEHANRLTDKTMFTEFGKIVGTLQYMSPEQAGLDALDIDTRTDVYSLGIMLYELLAGSTPLDSKTMQQEALLKVLEIIREKDPPRPSSRLSSTNESSLEISSKRKISADKLHRILHGELDWIVMKALEKDRRRRYETASAFADDIFRFLDRKPVIARPPSRRYRLSKFVSKNRTFVVSSVAVIASLIGATCVSTLSYFEARNQAELAKQQQKIADEERINASIQRKTADLKTKHALQEKKRADEERDVALEVRNFLQNSILSQTSAWVRANSRIDRRQSIRGNNVTVKEVLDLAAKKFSPEKIGQVFPKRPKVQAEILETISDSYAAISDFRESIRFAKASTRVTEVAYGRLSPMVIDSKVNLFFTYMAADRIDDAMVAANDVVARCLEAFDQADLSSVTSGETKSLAENMVDTGIDRFLIRMNPDRYSLPVVENDRITLKFATQTAMLIENMGILASKMESIYGENHDRARHCRMFEGFFLFAAGYGLRNNGQVQKSIATLDKAMPWVGTWQNEKALTGMFLQRTFATMLSLVKARPERTIELSESSANVIEEKLGNSHPSTLVFKMGLGEELFRQKRYEEALEVYLTYYPKYAFQFGDSGYQTIYHNLAKRLGRQREAYDAFRLQLDQLIEDYPDQERTYRAMMHIAVMDVKLLGDSSKAVQQCYDVLQMATAKYGSFDRITLDLELECGTFMRRYALDKDALPVLSKHLEKLRGLEQVETYAYQMAQRLYAHCLANSGDLQQAIPEMERSIRRRLEMGPNSKQIADDRWELARWYHANEQFKDAETLLRSMIKAEKRSFFLLGKDPDLRYYELGLAASLTELGKLEEAKTTWARLINDEKRKRHHLGEPSERLFLTVTLTRACASYLKTGEPEKALELIKEANELIASEKLKLEHRIPIQLQLGQCYLELNQPELAKTPLETADLLMSSNSGVWKWNSQKNQRRILSALDRLYQDLGDEESAAVIASRIEILESTSE